MTKQVVFPMENDGNHTEIELKLFILPQYQQPLITFLNQLPGSQSKGCRQLTNRYFDTPGLALRRMDMGLRVRGCDGNYEQTIKTAGTVVGGLHSRPEYNIDINGTTPELALFPAEIWPQTQDIAALQQQLHCLFSTDFQRHCWWVQEGASLIEVALDQGVIAAGNQREPLCEVEFELISGSAADLLPLAQKVAQQLPLRLGKASKAQRGYRLAQQGRARPLDTLHDIPLPMGGDVNACLTVIVETAIERWQLLEEWLQLSLDNVVQQAALWQQLRDCVRLLRLVLTQFALHNDLTLNGFAWLESQLCFIDNALELAYLCTVPKPLQEAGQGQEIAFLAQASLQQLDFAGHLQALWQDSRYGVLQLALVQLLFDLQRRQVLPSVTENLPNVSGKLLEGFWQQLQAFMSAKGEATAQYLALADVLEQGHLLGVAFGHLYPKAARDKFYTQWQDVNQQIVLLGACHRATQLLPAATAALNDIQHGLGLSIERSCRDALRQTPYWR
ncbi:inorganic triphosphatase [Shewanella sp.]|uniref:CYTH domain-containing protein n=1 Tax=Shewanella sp. TaxID=50422 RepID=UPI003D0B37A0